MEERCDSRFDFKNLHFKTLTCHAILKLDKKSTSTSSFKKVKNLSQLDSDSSPIVRAGFGSVDMMA